MSKKTWSERKWYHTAIVIVAFLGLLGVGVVGMIGGFSPASGTQAKIAGVVTMLLGFGSCFIAFLLPALDPPRSLALVRGDTFRCGVIEKQSKRLVAYDLLRATLKPSPFITSHSLFEYPTNLGFSLDLQPITTNPKVIPLKVIIRAKMRDFGLPADMIPHGAVDYMRKFGMQVAVMREFKRRIFELLQHQLPQELSNRLNPYDSTSQVELKGLVVRELNPWLNQYGFFVDELELRRKR